MKKYLFYVSIALLALTSSLVLALLSATGLWAMIATFPISLPIALVLVGLVFGLAIVYEWEIYWQNIKSAANKLFNKPMLLENKLGKEYLLDNFPDFNPDDPNDAIPEFFKDYKKLILALDKLNHKEVSNEEQRFKQLQKKRLTKQLAAMEKRFTRVLFTKLGAKDNIIESDDDYLNNACDFFLNDSNNPNLQRNCNNPQACLAKLKRLNIWLYGAKAFAILAGFFMGVSTTYLLVEALTAMTFFSLAFSFWPFIIIPLAVAAGLAYGFLTYNAVSEMIVNETLQNWFHKLKQTIKEPWNLRVLLIALLSVVLIGLAVTLTVFTAGTWWTIAQKSRPLFGWMAKIPSWIMAVSNISIIGLSSLIFNLQNMYETLGMIETFVKGSFHNAKSVIQQQFQHLKARDNIFQLLNPFRIIITAIELPLRIILFLGHIISIALSTDRPPKVPHWIAFAFGFTVELGEDLHYFFEASEADHSHEHHNHSQDHEHHENEFKKTLMEYGHQHSHSHHHGLDIPTWLIRLALSPLYALAILWDFGFQDQSHKRDSFWHSFCVQTGYKDELAYNSDVAYELDVDLSEQASVQVHLNKVDKCLAKSLSQNEKDKVSLLKKSIQNNPSNLNNILATRKNKLADKRKWFFQAHPEKELVKTLQKIPVAVASPAA